ncbi:MAG: hypothetical protein WC889_18845, partial [Myxococcota bacterium]
MNDWNARGFELMTPFGAVVTLAVIAVVAAGLVLSIRGLHTYLSNWQKAVLASLRIVAAVAVVALFLEPAEVLKKVSFIKSRVAVILDTSRSMSQSAGLGGVPRIAASLGWMSGARGWFDTMAARYNPAFFTFDGDARQVVASSLLGGDAGGPLADGKETDILKALEAAASGGTPLSGVVLVTDGQDRAGLSRAFDP